MYKSVPNGLPILWVKGVGPVAYDEKNEEVYADCVLTDERVNLIKEAVGIYKAESIAQPPQEG